MQKGSICNFSSIVLTNHSISPLKVFILKFGNDPRNCLLIRKTLNGMLMKFNDSTVTQKTVSRAYFEDVLVLSVYCFTGRYILNKESSSTFTCMYV